MLFVKVLEEYCENLLTLKEYNRRSETTVSTYLNILGRVKQFVLEKHPDLTIDEVGEGLLYNLLEGAKPRKADSLATNTINKYSAIFRSVLGYSFENGYTKRDLRYKFTLQKTFPKSRYLNDEQIEEVLARTLQKTYGYRKRAIAIFLLGTGCRVSGLTNIKVCDFNVKENLILLKEKGEKERYVPMFPEVKKCIIHYLKMSGVEEWSADIKGYLFAQDEGLVRKKQISNRSVQNLFRGVFDSIGLNRDYTVHSFRHTFAVRCLKVGIREPYLMQMLGHEDPQSTSVYTKLLPLDLKEQVMKNYPFPFENLLDDLI
ncbi:tyrosine-type recombinase/integrase [Oceanobacillus sp. CAU 1775]